MEGRVVIPGGMSALERAAVHVRLEDVSAADAASRLVAETVVRDVSHRASGEDTIVPFALRGRLDVDPTADYAVRAWVDHDGDGSPSSGDLYSDQRYPVLTRGFGRTVEVVLGASDAGVANRKGWP